jgi:hypothetical protein
LTLSRRRRAQIDFFADDPALQPGKIRCAESAIEYHAERNVNNRVASYAD